MGKVIRQAGVAHAAGCSCCCCDGGGVVVDKAHDGAAAALCGGEYDAPRSAELDVDGVVACRWV